MFAFWAKPHPIPCDSPGALKRPGPDRRRESQPRPSMIHFPWPYLWLDASYVKVREGVRSTSSSTATVSESRSRMVKERLKNLSFPA